MPWPVQAAMLALALVAMVFGGLVIGTLATDVRRQIEVLASANADAGHVVGGDRPMWNFWR